MKSRQFLVSLLIVVTALLCLSVWAQVNRPFRNGTVWDIAFVKVKPGMEVAYLNYLASDWKKEQEVLKKEGLIISYKVLATEAHSPGDWNLMLMTEYKDLATLEANKDKMDALAQKVIGDDEMQMQRFRQRGDLREVVGGRLAREIILEPKSR